MCAHEHDRPQSLAPTPEPGIFFSFSFCHFQVPARPFHLVISPAGRDGEGVGVVASSRSGKCACARVFFINHMPPPTPPLYPTRRKAQRPPYALFLEVADPLARSLAASLAHSARRRLAVQGFFFEPPQRSERPFCPTAKNNQTEND